jgi:hypothetical protein
MARWQERTRGPNWLVDESGRLLGYKDADGDVHTIPSGHTGQVRDSARVDGAERD